MITTQIDSRLRTLEGLLSQVIPTFKRGDESSEEYSESVDSSGDEQPQPDYRGSTSTDRRPPVDDNWQQSLQVVDLQTIETDSASSPFSYAFHIDAFSRKVSAVDGEFRNLGHGKFLRQANEMFPQLEQIQIETQLAGRLLDYYFREMWPLFPIIDRDAIYSQLRDRTPLPPISLLTAIYFAAASSISQLQDIHSAASSPALSPRSPATLPPGLLDSLRASLTAIVSTLSTPILEPRISTLQTIVLRCLYDSTLSCEQRAVLVSDAVRIAQYILLHRVLTNLPPRDKSLRKHLWWTIFLLEVWTSANDQIASSVDLAEVDVPMPIESEEIDHLTYTAVVALTRILQDSLRGIYSPNVRQEDIPREVVRLREWVMDWYCNLPAELLVAETGIDGESADFLLATCHTVLLMLYKPFTNEDLVRSEIGRSQGIIMEALGRIGRNMGKFGIIASLVGHMVRRSTI